MHINSATYVRTYTLSIVPFIDKKIYLMLRQCSNTCCTTDVIFMDASYAHTCTFLLPLYEGLEALYGFNFFNNSTTPLHRELRDYSLGQIPYSYKFSRDVYFADTTNSAFSRFYFRGSQDFVLVYYVGTILI